MATTFSIHVSGSCPCRNDGQGLIVASLSLVAFATLFWADALAALFALAMLWLGRRNLLALLIGAISGAVCGIALTWWFGDVQGILGTPPTAVDRGWSITVFAGLGVTAALVIRQRRLARVVAVVGSLSLVVAGCLAVNRDGGLFPKVSDVLGDTRIPALHLEASHLPSPSDVSFNPSLYRTWSPPPDMPNKGRYGSVTIPGAVSHFVARPAIIYLPPAALVAHPPRLPVLIVMSGQGPGAAPYNVVDAGHIISTMNKIAMAHHGLTPIVVIPDQLKAPTNNPMCVDGPLGNSETYLTVDVTRWIRTHLPVQTGRQAWTIAGFSQGGTCALQLGAGHPTLFGSFIDVSGERGPILNSVRATIQRGFSGDAAAYRAAQPAAVMAQHGPYRNTAAFFAVGAMDVKYGPAQPVVAEAARGAGIHVKTWIINGASHDWSAAGRGLAKGTRWLLARVGLAAPVTVRQH